MRVLTEADVSAAVRGGSVLASGGGGWVDHGFRLGHTAVGYGEVRMVTLDEVPDDAVLVTVAAIGAPAARGWRMLPRDYVRAVELVMQHFDGKVTGLINSQNGSSSTLNPWLPAAVLGLLVVDAAGNGRAHPTAKMGSMGLAGRDDIRTVQVVVGGDPALGTDLELVVKGTVRKCANILREASVQAGGFIASARNPVPAAYVREHGAVGAVSYALRIGAGMVAAAPRGAGAVVDAILAATGGRILGRGPVRHLELETRGAWDFGHLVVDSGSAPLTLHFMNEYLAAEAGGERLSTFPDVIATLSVQTGLPVSVAQMEVGTEVAVLAIPKGLVPLGAGMWDPTCYTEVEEKTGLQIAAYALAGR